MINAGKYQKAFQRFLYGKPGSDGEWRAYCPIHEDPDTSKSPSASINFELGVWHCASCDAGGTVRALYRTMRQQRGESAPKPERDKPNNVVKMDKPLPSGDQLRFWHKTLIGKPGALAIMTDKRGLTIETLRRYLIGWDGQRFTVPIYDEDGELANVRRYKPNAKQSGHKMISWGPGHGTGRLYGIEVLDDNDWVIYAEGELDRLIGMQHGFPTITDTSGAGVFKQEWAPYFKDKVVYFAYDDDKQGDAGAMKGAKVLKDVARAVYRMRLDTGIDGGDLTDFFVRLGRDSEDLEQVRREAIILHEAGEAHVVPEEGRMVSVEQSQGAKQRETLSITAQVAGKMTPPFVVPKMITGICDMSAGPVCNSCPLMVEHGKMRKEFSPDDENLVDFLRRNKANRTALLGELLGAKCKKHIDVRIDDEYHVEELVLAPSPDHISDDMSPINRVIYNVGTYATQENSTINVVCKQIPDPNDQRGVLVGWKLNPVNTDIDDFKMTPETISRLKKFRPRQGQSSLDKCIDIARDLIHNVTHIYGRELTHVGYDLVWHSILSFNFGGKNVRKGWLEALTIGDTRTGKSEAVTALRRHYAAGLVTSCEGASLAGLIGGAVNSSIDKKSWMINWGLLPNNDRRLVVLDEMSGLMSQNKAEIIGNMSSIRSEGKAVVRKVVQGEANARTRIIWLSNPSDGTKISDLPGSALRSIKKMIRNPEDIARFDFVTAVANDEVPSSVINSLNHKVVHHRYTAQSCHDLIMWAWSRKPEDVRWARGAEQAVLDAAQEMGERYVSDPPLVQPENIRIKIARIAVAIAARTFSASKDGRRLIVKPEHVDSAVQFLDAIYSTEAMGYLRASNRQKEDRQAGAEHKPALRKMLENMPNILAVIRAIGGDTFRAADFITQAAMDREEVNEVMQRLTEWHMIRRGAAGALTFEPALTQVIREMEDDGI